MSLWLELEVSAGSTIHGICDELIETQRRLGIRVRVKFNDKMLLAGPQTTAQELVDEYWKSSRPNPSESPNS